MNLKPALTLISEALATTQNILFKLFNKDASVTHSLIS